MHVVIHTNHAEHQRQHATPLKSGFERHGIAAEFAPYDSPRLADMVVIWGWNQKQVIQQAQKNNVPLLVMERGFLPDRMQWSSLGWNGLNGRASFPHCLDNGERFERNWGCLLKPWRVDGEYALLCGQVPGDAALNGADPNQFAQQIVDELRGKIPIVFRPHPACIRRHIVWCPKWAKQSTNERLEEDLAGAKFCVVYNSNSAVEAVLAGVPAITFDRGAMAWPVASHSIAESLQNPDRTTWAHRLAWCQWQLEEISNGTAWEVLRTQIQ